MYTFNILCFGHEMAKDKQLNNELNDWDIEFSMKINDRMWEVDFPYHGGQIGYCSCVFGIRIADDDNSPNYIEEIRTAKEEDFIDDYNKFLQNLLDGLEKDVEIAGIHEKEIKLIVDKLNIFVKNNKPKFYSVEASS